MKNLRTRNVIALILNVIIIALLGMGFCYAFISRTYPLSYLYSDIACLTNAIILIFSIIGLIMNVIRIVKNKPLQCSWVFAFQLMITILALAVVLFYGLYVRPTGDSAFGWIKIIGFYYIPSTLFIIIFLFFETEKVRNWAYSLIAPVLYAAYTCALILCACMGWLKTDFAYYDIFKITQWFTGTDWWRAMVEIVVIIIGGFGVGFGFLAINRALSKRAVGQNDETIPQQSFADGEPVMKLDEEVTVNPNYANQETKLEEEPVIEIEPEIKSDIVEKKKTSTKKIDKKLTDKKENNNKDKGPGVYHISKRSDNNQWQVKLANGKKAIKFFKTQGEAVAYAKQLTETQGGSIRVHSLKGKIKKVN